MAHGRSSRSCHVTCCLRQSCRFKMYITQQLGDERIEGARRNLSLLYAHYGAVATPAVERWHACKLEPPVLPVTDASIIASNVDATILIYQSNKTSRHLLLRAMHTLEKNHANVIGIVINQLSYDVTMHQSRASGYSGYGYY